MTIMHPQPVLSVLGPPVEQYRSAATFLRLLDPSATGFTFQTFHDKKPPTKPELARVIESPAMPDLLQLHALGAGVYVTVNATDNKGRRSENITRVRAVWQENDGGFDGSFPLAPSMIIESSPGHFHRYWLVGDEWLADEQGRTDFAAIMERMVESYGSDKNAKDISRVLRLPGFLHRKNGPVHQVRVIDESGWRYSRAEIIAAFPPVERAKNETPQHEWKPRDDDDQRIRDALSHIDPDDRDTWLQIGMALKDHYGDSGRQSWDEWSLRSHKYNEQEQDKAWRSFRRQGITIGTLFHHAKLAGWKGKKPSSAAAADSIDDDDDEIKRLAGLSQVQYERERKAAAERLGMRAAILDKLVQAERPDDDESKQGRAISFPEPEPWPEAVHGAALLELIADAIRRHVVLSDHSRDAAALWVLHSYLYDRFTVSPRLAIRSPTKRCGKTTLLDVLSGLVLRPLPTANVTAAAVFRVVEAYRPTLLVDEADTFLRDNDELRGIINSGHRRGGSVLRTVGDDHEPRQFATFSPCVIALIGTLPETLHDRSVVIDLKRRLPNETIDPFRVGQMDHLEQAARQALRWCRDHAESIAGRTPSMPAGIVNREADNWQPLLAIADEAGGEWPRRAREAAEQGHEAADDESRLVVLLGDIKAVFAEKKTDRLPSIELAEALASIEGRPWAEYRHGKPISQNQLARALKPVGVTSENIKMGERVPKGYLLDRFNEAFGRYLSPEGVLNPLPRYFADEIRTTCTFQSATDQTEVAVQKCEKPFNDGPGSGVAVQKGENSLAHEEGASGVSGNDHAEIFPLVCQHCGNAETPTEPVREYVLDGDRCLLHPRCEVEWLH